MNITGLQGLMLVASVTTSVVVWLRRPWRRQVPKDRAQRTGGTGHFLVLVGPDRCRCGNEWPCLDSVPADRLTRQL
jgi:hypothetical protein